MEELNRLRWFKSSYSAGNNGAGNCVETAAVGSHRALRDSKDPSGPSFVFSRDSFDRFISAVKTGDFDR
jgi:Domain of unknown function (DUF397)